MILNDLDQVTFYKEIGLAGTSLTLRITKEADLLGLKKGDVVKVTLEKIK